MPDPQISSAPALPSARSAQRPLLTRLAEAQWALTGLGLALLVVLLLPSAQIKLGASQLNGLVGSYTSGSGHYDVSYTSSGGTTVTTTTPPNGPVTNFTPYSAQTSQNAPGAWGGGAFTYIQGGGGSGSIQCAGKITANFTWNGGPNNDPAPASGSVIVAETANVAWGGPNSSGSSDIPNGTTPASTPPNYTATRYTVNGGQSFSVNCTPTASMSGTSPQPYQTIGGSAYVGYTASATIAPVRVQGDSTVDTAGWDSTHPRFFSGTNCSVSGTGSAVGNNYVQQATLSVNGTTVKQYTDAGTHQSSVTLSANFDSTHFQDGIPFPIKMSVTDSSGNTYSSAPTQANAYNHIYILGDIAGTNQGSSSKGDILGLFSSGNITPTPSSAVKGDIIAAIPTYSIFYAYTHGLPGLFGDGQALTTSSNSDYVYSADVSAAVGNKTSTQPAYNFVFLCACQCAGDATLANAFGISDSSTDRAFLSFTTNVDDTPRTQAWAKAIFSDLKAGMTLQSALADMNPTQIPQNGHSDATVKYIGDPTTTIDGTVYGGAIGSLSK